MARARLTIDLDAIVSNWRALDALSGPAVETAAVVKADAYGLGLAPVARALRSAGVRSFFVALAEEGLALRRAIGPGAAIYVFSGYMAGDASAVREAALVPLLNCLDQAVRFRADHPDAPTGLQIDSGMNRLGLEPAEMARLPALNLSLVMSHLACADTPHHPLNEAQRIAFAKATTGLAGTVPRSLAATGGILLGAGFHFAMTRPGIGLFGGLPFAGGRPVVSLELPVIQVRDLAPGEAVGYGADWIARDRARIATLSAGYADGLMRSLAGRATVHAGDTPCPLAGRVSMDLLTVDVSHLAEVPDSMTILGPAQGIDTLAAAAGTIGYEVLTALGPRYERRYKGGAPGPGEP